MAGEGEDSHGSRRRSASYRHVQDDDNGRQASSADAPDSKENGHRRRDSASRDSYRQKERFRDDGDYDRRRDERGRERNLHYRDDNKVAERRNHYKEYEYDKDRRHRHHRSRSRERDQEHHSHSRSHSRDRKSKRTSGFDMGPSGSVGVTTAAFSGAMLNPQSGSLLSTAAGLGSALPTLGQIPGMGSIMPGVYPSMFPFAGGTQATRHARRVYVGGLPIMANEQHVAAFFSQVMAAIGGNTAGPGDAVVNVYINQEKRFAFVEMRTVEEASNAMALDGIVYEGVAVRVRRPTDYNPSLAATLGPSQPSPHLNLAAIGLIPGAAGCADGPERIFVGGLPYYLTEEQIIDLLSSFGPLRAFDLVKDRETGTSKGYAFCIYQDSAVMDIACAALNGLKMGDRTLTVRRASASGQPKPDQANILVQAQQQIAIQKLLLASGGNPINEVNLTHPGSGMMVSGGLSLQSKEVPTRIVRLSNVVSEDELRDDTTYEEICEDMREECAKYGNLIDLVIPRPSLDQEVPGLGMVFVQYTDPDGAEKAKTSLNGRKFGSNAVTASYYSEERFSNGDYGG